jgi:prevent-host-death family protein
MLVFTYSEARKKLAEVLDLAREDEVIIKRRNGETFSLTEVRKRTSPLDVCGVTIRVTTSELVAAVMEGRER